jgi:hypothetical protein
MKEKNHCEVFGTLEKTEEFRSITNNIIPGSLVFESPAPFLGYYNDVPGEYSPLYIYIGVDKTYAAFDITRAAMAARKELGIEFDAAKAFVSFNDRFFNAIRLRHLQDYAHFKEIQEAFARHGIRPMMLSTRWNKVTASVIFKKVFCLAPIANGIWKDDCEQNHFYLEIPKAVLFHEFTEITHSVKNNWLGAKFDAALGAFIQLQRVVEIVRIYSETIKEDELVEIQKLYYQKMRGY